MTTDMHDQSLCHRHTWDLIPWIVNGTASSSDRQLADEHLRNCANCRDELVFQRQVHAAMTTEAAPEYDAHMAFKRLFTRIDDEPRDGADFAGDTPIHALPRATHPLHAWHAPARFKWTRNRARLLAVVVAAQTVGLVLLGVLVLAHPSLSNSNASYQTLSRSSPSAGAATIRFVPTPGMTVGAMQALLADAKLRIVESNRGSSIYGLAPEPEMESDSASDTSAVRAQNTEVAIARLRSQPGVLLVEPIVSPATRAR